MSPASTTYIWHVGLGIGQGTRETRAHLTDDDLAGYHAHINRALASAAGDPVPGHPDYAMAAHEISRALVCTVGRIRDQLALCTFTVVVRSNQAAKAWKALHTGYPEYAASLGDVPRTPYCAVRAEFGLARDLAAGEWLDRYQISVAWAWISKDGR